MAVSDPIVTRAKALTSEQWRQLATLEQRSRDADREAYRNALDELGEKAPSGFFTACVAAVERAQVGRDLDIETATVGGQAVQQASIAGVMGTKVSEDCRRFMGRAWRALMKELGETS